MYDDLRRVAARQLRGASGAQTLTPTAVVNEAYLRLEAQMGSDWQDRHHFFAVAATAMRCILVDHARRRLAGKRNPDARPTLDLEGAAADEWAVTMIALDDALARLARIDERMHRVVECRFFGGLTEEETAQTLGVASRTVHRDWLRARAWLELELRD